MKKKISKRILGIFLLSSLIAVGCGGKQDPIPTPEPEPEPEPEPVPVQSYYPKSEGAFRLVTYNVGNFGKYITDMNENIKLVADMMKELEADVVGLNELDYMNSRHQANQAKELALAMGGWQWYFGRAISYKGGLYGNGAVLPEDVKISRSYTISLPNTTTYESRAISFIETEKYVLAVTHLDHGSEDYIQSQISTVNDWVLKNYNESPKPVFLLGDMNSYPDSEAIKALETQWEVISSLENSYSTVNPRRCIDYIFHLRSSGAVTVIEGHTPMKFYCGDVTQASDHHPVYVDVKF